MHKTARSFSILYMETSQERQNPQSRATSRSHNEINALSVQLPGSVSQDEKGPDQCTASGKPIVKKDYRLKESLEVKPEEECSFTPTSKGISQKRMDWSQGL